MLTRVLTFTPDATGQLDFTLAYEAFKGRGAEKIDREERRQLAEIQRALEAVSEPFGDLPANAPIDLRPRKLKADGGTITLLQRTFEKFTGYAEAAAFQAAISAQVEDFLDRLSAAEKVDADQVDGNTQKPRAVKRG